MGRIRELGKLTVYDRTAPDEIAARAREAGVILTNKAPISAATLEKLPDIRFISVMATGYDIVDIEAAGRRGIPQCPMFRNTGPIQFPSSSSLSSWNFAIMWEFTKRL